MNRSILIVICDFLLITLLAFSTVDINKVNQEGPHALKLNQATNQVDASKDLTAVMRLALDEERKGRDQLMGELARTRASVNEQQVRLSEQQTRLGEREKQVQTYQQEIQNFQGQIQSREQEAQRLQKEQAGLQQQLVLAQTNIATLGQQLHTTSTEAVLSKEKLAAMEAEMKKQNDQAAALQQQLALLARSNQVVQVEKQQLATQLQVAEVEKKAAAEQVVHMTEQVKVEREEKAKLAEGVKVLATKSSQLAQELRDNRPLAPNTIFNSFVTNRVMANFNAYRSTLFGIDANRRRLTETVLVNNGTNTYALCHVQDTPLTFFDPGTEWESLTGTLAHNQAQVGIRSVSFHLHDPRIMMMPVTSVEATQLGCAVYRLATDPFKFQDAVLVGAREGYYGECRFQIDLSTPDYLKLDRSFLKGLFGKFNPSSGDLVFSKNGELLGIMANNTYCLMLQNFDSSASLRFGQDVRAQHTGGTLSQLYSIVAQLPLRLQ
jgi:hypothetical protein